MKLFAGNSNRVLAEGVARYLNVPIGKASVRRFADQEIFVEIQENVRGEDVFILQSTSFPDQRPPDGTADHDRCVHALVGAPHHRRDPLFRLCPAGPPRLRPHADLGQARRQHDHPRRRRPRADARPACRPDPGLLRHPDRQSLRRAGHGPRREGEIQAARTTSWSSRPTSAAWCAPARWPSASTRSSPSSTSAASGRANPRS